MADRLNDTDPQSPRAIVTRTDPGLGTAGLGTAGPSSRPSGRPPRVEATPLPPPPPAVAPSQGSESIEALLDGITGPRPPISKRDTAPDGMRAYAAARHAPASQPMPPHEPLVVSPEPPRSGSAPGLRLDLEATMPRRPEPFSTRPVVGRAAEERTVYTGRRALLRNLAVLVGSSAVVGMMMMSIMRWKEAHRQQPSSAAAMSAPAVPEAELSPAPVDLPVVPSVAPRGGGGGGGEERRRGGGGRGGSERELGETCGRGPAACKGGDEAGRRAR